MADVITLDLEMPRMNGLTFLRKLMKYHPLPVVVVSSLTPEGSEAAVRATELGAVDVISKPGTAYSVAEISGLIIDRIRGASTARILRTAHLPSVPRPVERSAAEALRTSHKVVAIGASTGGPQAVEAVLRGLPADTPGTLIVQHLPEGFTNAYARRVNELCQMEVREAKDNDPVVPGVALVAQGNRHMLLRRSGARYFVHLKDGPPVHHQRPSVDVLFHSVARQAGPNAVGAILTGMGRDGAQGLLAMRKAGAHTLAQDEASCVVFGMPKEAIRSGAVERVVGLDRIPGSILNMITDSAQTSVRA